jgi:hypothetical protein
MSIWYVPIPFSSSSRRQLIRAVAKLPHPSWSKISPPVSLSLSLSLSLLHPAFSLLRPAFSAGSAGLHPAVLWRDSALRCRYRYRIPPSWRDSALRYRYRYSIPRSRYCAPRSLRGWRDCAPRSSYCTPRIGRGWRGWQGWRGQRSGRAGGVGEGAICGFDRIIQAGQAKGVQAAHALDAFATNLTGATLSAALSCSSGCRGQSTESEPSAHRSRSPGLRWGSRP